MAPPRALALLILAALLAGCGSRHTGNAHTITPTPSEGPLIGRSTLDMAIPIAGWDACIVPFVMENQKGWFRDRDPFTKGGMATYARTASSFGSRAVTSRAVRWHNALIKNFSRDETLRVLDTRGVISRYATYGYHRQTDDPNSFRITHIIFIVTTDDTNSDGMLDDRDASRAYVLDMNLRKIEPVTPADGQVWGIVKGFSSRFFFRIAHDTNGDGQFTDADSATLYTWRRRKDLDEATPIIDDAEIENLQALLE